MAWSLFNYTLIRTNNATTHEMTSSSDGSELMPDITILYYLMDTSMSIT